ncbi:efflux RND transporter periplasmic adaptor subunit [Sutcliffiella deserti]|uniref:hypothetical protein n=1 Tax=Sutcliffiella deserti TaxID=2875501 RepID=UPI001CBD8B16|nr:hypothetical protein [Sutcliffiella deserti]
MAKVVKQMQALETEEQAIRQEYQTALKSAEADVVKLSAEIAEAEVDLKEIYKHYVLNITSLDSYNTEKKALEDKKATLKVAQQKVIDVDKLMKEELYEVRNKAKEMGLKFQQETRKLIGERKKLMVEAREKYIQAIKEASIPIVKQERYDVWLSELEVELGLKEYSYATNINSHYFIGESLDGSGKGSAVVTKEEVQKVYGRK